MSADLYRLLGVIPLSEICEPYLGLDPKSARVRATAGTLPIPAFRLGPSQKLPYVVSIEQLRKHIAKVEKSAKREHEEIGE